jgi:hypothetical protein
MSWHIQYRDEDGEHVLRESTPEQAIEVACGLIDEGRDVFGIGTGPLTDSIDQSQIVRIYDLWSRAKHPFGMTR